MTQKHEQVWFITGANKGLGAAIAKKALGMGHKVVATARNPQSAEGISPSKRQLPRVGRHSSKEQGYGNQESRIASIHHRS